MQGIGIRGALVAAALAVAGVAPQAAAAQTLAGEQLASAAHSEAVTYEGTCNPEGESTFTYYTWGSATGPFPGLMQETGTFTLASPAGPVTTFTASYVIDANDGTTVEGFKTLLRDGTGSCSVSEYGSSDFDVQIPASYAVTSPFTDTGEASVNVQGIAHSGVFGATFGSRASRPASKQDCMNGGYARYGFSNQGECVAWVNHNG